MDARGSYNLLVEKNGILRFCVGACLCELLNKTKVRSV